MQDVKRVSVCASLFVMVLVLMAVHPCLGDDEEFSGKVRKTIEQFKKADPEMSKFFNTARGYAVFPTVTKAGIGIGAARGRGLVYEQGRVVGEVKMTQGTIGAQVGAKSYSQVVFFENQETMDSFKESDFALSAQATATAAAAGAAANAKYKLGVSIFIMSKSGLMAEASVGGQKFHFIPLKK